jgi:formimidoylglutamate deiminase
MTILYRPELLFVRGEFLANAGLLVDDAGYISDVVANQPSKADQVIALPGKALLPGFVNAHSHSFQRLIRGKAESRAASGRDFWSWRGCMYHAAASLEPGDVYDVARMAFLEMLMTGVTTVGEFHYLHTMPDGRTYDDPNLLAKQVIAAAQSIGIRIVLLRTAYFRSGYNLPPDPGQARFIENTRSFLENMHALTTAYTAEDNTVSFGVAPHSIRAVPLADLNEIAAWGRERRLPIHMHVAEQVAENKACMDEYGATPVALLGKEGILGSDFTGVHSIHMDSREAQGIADAGSTICSCPTTERNLGDGIIAADVAMKMGIHFALGSDSQAQISPLEDARELEYHLRLAQQQRSILDQISGRSIASRLFDCATLNGARSLGVNAGELRPGAVADFFTVGLNDLSICGHSPGDLLSTIVFSLERTAVRDVAVQGRLIVCDGVHPHHDEVTSRYTELHKRVWRGAAMRVSKP